MKKALFTIISGAILAACTVEPDNGVSQSLAQERKALLHGIRYELSFDIPECRDSALEASEVIRFCSGKKSEVILDFKENAENLHSISINGKELPSEIINEHIILPAKFIDEGENTVEIVFRAGELSLNRRDEFLYTLLVPDRARTLFPCFDQPDLKSAYTLTLTIPEDWTAVSNTAISSEKLSGKGRKRVTFACTEPLSTYLFSFVAGKFERASAERNGRTISIYHRENEPEKVSQCGKILDLIFDALEYMEEYTGMPYPFAKYDCVAIPDFQYGGMEHTGATLYNARSLFTDSACTTAELQNRASLIAHETAHMWFGDCVTMRWFDDVWTKEVFANWFAARIIRPAFPEINYAVSDLFNYYSASYEEDRTIGSNAIWRPLDNLKDAGLIYCNIIYDKAPVVMEKLNRAMGEDAFRDCIREYIQTYAYDNASWDDLISIMDSHADFDVEEWSRVWVKEKGMPEYSFSYDSDGSVKITQKDPFGAGNVWQQDVKCLDEGEGRFVPNVEGDAYGYFELTPASAGYICEKYGEFDETARMSLLMTLYENAWRKAIPSSFFLNWCADAIQHENSALILESLIAYGAEIALFTPAASGTAFNESLLKLAMDSGKNEEERLIAFRKLHKTSDQNEVLARIFEIWDTQSPPDGLKFGEYDYTEMAYTLMLHFPDRYEYIKEKQRKRINNPDRLESFEYICRALSDDAATRKDLFDSMRTASGRRPEARVLKALGFLCHRLRGQEAIGLIGPALELLPDVQRYGDIFFPTSWCLALLSGQTSNQAANEVRTYLENHRDLNPLLRTKVLQAAGHLLR